MREGSVMFEHPTDKGKLQLQCKVGQQRCSYILQNLSGVCFTVTIWNIIKSVL